MLGFFKCVAEAIVHKGVSGLLVEFVPGGQYVADVAGDAWKRWKQHREQKQLRAEVEKMAAATFEEVRAAAKQVAREVAPEDDALAQNLELYLTQIPTAVKQSLKRPDDLSGTTVPADFVVRDEDDVARLLPPRMPRFRPGDAPPFLKGWVLEEQVGAGGFGEVWKGRNKRAASLTAAFKFGHSLSDRDLSLLHEGDVIDRVMAQGRHPGIVALEDVWADGDAVPWLRFEYVAGGDLTGLIHAWQRLSATERLAKATAALRDLAETVGFFHRLEPAIVHRDLKPSNILVDRASSRLKVADFGIGAVSARRLLDGEAVGSISRGGRLQSYLRGSHTPLYASPQQRAGSRDLDPRDDVHALGVIAYQMISGRLDLGAGPDFADDLRDHGAPEPLVVLLSRCVAQKPDRRPKDAKELAEALAGLVRPVEEPPFAELVEESPAPPPAKPAPTAPSAVRPVTATKRPNVSMPGLAHDFASAVKFCTLAGHTDTVNSVAFSPDGRMLATASDDETARLWEVATGRVLRTLTGHESTVMDVAFSPDGKVLATASMETAKLWDVVTGRQIRTYTINSELIWVLAFSPDGRVLATGGERVRLWSANSGCKIRTLTGHKHEVEDVAFSPDGRVLATASADKTARLWDVGTGRELHALAGDPGVAFSPDGRVLATANGDDKAVSLWDIATGREIRSLSGHTNFATEMAFSPDGRVLATADGTSSGGAITLWDTTTGCELRRLTEQGCLIDHVAFSPDGRVLATGGDRVRLWRSLRSDGK